MHANHSSHAIGDRRDRPHFLVETPRARWRGVAGVIALVAVTFVAYIPALRSGYVWDDDQYLTDNHLVQTPRRLAAIWAIWYDHEAGRLRINTPQYYPLVYTSYWIEHLLWGLQPAGYHAVNVLLHALSALLIWRITQRLRVPAGWFIAAVFALHPVHVESVAWITERKNVLSGFFYLLALLAFLRFFEASRAKWYMLGVLLFIAALLSKTVTATLPIAIVLVRWYQRRRISGRDVLLLTPMVVLGAAAGLLTAHLERSHVGALGSEWSQSFLERSLIIAPRAFWFYASKIAWPHPLIFIYPRWEIDTGAWVSYLPLFAVLAALGLASAGVRRFGWGPLLLLLYAGATLTPALGFFQVYPHRFSWVADHFQYLASLGFIALYTIIVVRLGTWLAPSRRAVAAGRAGGIGLLLILGSLTFRQSRSYENAQRLWQDTLAANPDAWIASLNLGILASQAGRYDSAAESFEHTARYPVARSEAYGSWGTALLRLNRPDGAIAMFEKSLAANPKNPKSYAGLAAAYAQAGRLDLAEQALQEELRLDPERPMAWLNLGMLRSRQERRAEAERCFQRAIALAPHLPGARLAYADLLSDTKRWRAAAEQYRAAQCEWPSAFTASPQLVNALFESGDYAEALRVCQEALEENPKDVRLLQALAWIRATCPVDALRDGVEALHIATQLARGVGQTPRVLDTLACAYGETGDFDRAVVVGEQALQAAKSAAASDLAAEIEGHLELFRSRKPYRHTGPRQDKG
jgi:tetratricopeptide (TPR) repeat protein